MSRPFSKVNYRQEIQNTLISAFGSAGASNYQTIDMPAAKKWNIIHIQANHIKHPCFSNILSTAALFALWASYYVCFANWKSHLVFNVSVSLIVQYRYIFCVLEKFSFIIVAGCSADSHAAVDLDWSKLARIWQELSNMASDWLVAWYQSIRRQVWKLRFQKTDRQCITWNVSLFRQEYKFYILVAVLRAISF